VALTSVLGSVLLYGFVSSRQLQEQKSALLAKQRAAVQEIGGRWYPLRDKLEDYVLRSAGKYEGDVVDPEALDWDFRSQPGIYLRLRLQEATTVEALRRTSKESLRDGFTGCLLRHGSPAATGEVTDAGPYGDQPWNLRQAYGAARILSNEWVEGVKDAENELRLRVFAQQYDKAVAQEIPLAADIVTRAKFFLLILDEDPADATDATNLTDGGAVTEESLQLVAHPSRVHLLHLKTGKELVRLRRTGQASYVFAGEGTVADEETRSAMQRQVNNCSLASQVSDALTKKGSSAAP
jgi:hypothetical protein